MWHSRVVVGLAITYPTSIGVGNLIVKQYTIVTILVFFISDRSIMALYTDDWSIMRNSTSFFHHIISHPQGDWEVDQSFHFDRLVGEVVD